MNNKSKALEYLNIARSTFYYKSVLDEKDEVLRQKIERVIEGNPSYGHRRIAIELKLNRKQIKRVMKKFGLKPTRGRKSLGNTVKMTITRHQTFLHHCFRSTKDTSGLQTSHI